MDADRESQREKGALAPSHRHLDRARAPLRPGQHGRGLRPLAPADRVRLDGRDVWPPAGPRVPAQRHPHTGPRGAVQARLRKLSPLGSVRSRASGRARRRRTGSRWPSAWSRRRRRSGLSSCCCSVTRSTPTIRPTRSSLACVRRILRTRQARCRRPPRRSRTSRSTPGCTTRRGRRQRCAGCFRPCRAACSSTTTTSATTGTRPCRGVGGSTAQAWWPGRVKGAYASYWVYQHLGNLSPDGARRR